MFSKFGLLLLLITGSQAAVLTLKSPRLTVTSAGDQARSEQLSLTKTIAPVLLGKDDILKVTFQVVEKDSGDGVQPHQTFLRFYDKTTGEEGIQPVRVTGGGKAKFELNMAKPPASLPPTADAPLAVSLLIGHPSHSPLSVNLFDLHLPVSLPPPTHPDEALFHPLPEIHHTFRPDQKQPPKPISLIFSALVLLPWFILFALWTQVAPGITHLFSLSIFPFITTLGAFEGLLVWYWVDLKLGQVLLYGALLGLVTTFTGKQALSTIAEIRIGRK